ncbi:MAG: polysaccharide deacetylase family protein [Rhodospirillales bacterium]|nr:polysaccharide deacetylase family protein [Rhodospirillales bacterium]
MAKDLFLPQEGFVVETYRRFIDEALNLGFKFITPEQAISDPPQEAPGLVITFDDGYADGLNILPVLKEYGVPATFFVSTDYVRDQMSFWWDVVYRNRRRQGHGDDKIAAELHALRHSTPLQINNHLMTAFGPSSLAVVTDDERPLTAQELQTMANDPLVVIGNHTAEHAVLPLLTRTDAAQQITRAQDYLRDVTGRTPSVISYPNGYYNADIIAAAVSAGLGIGITTQPRSNRPNLSAFGAMQLGRHAPPNANNFSAFLRGLRKALQLNNAWRAYRESRRVLPRQNDCGGGDRASA